MCLNILRVVNVACSICCVHPGNWKGLSIGCVCVEKRYRYCYGCFGEWGFESIIGLYGKKLLNCFVFHCSMSNFQKGKFGKVK